MKNKHDKTIQYYEVLESLMKNYKIKGFVVSVLTERTENVRKVVAILKVMADKYERTMSEKCLNMMAEMVNFKAEGGIENTTDKFGKNDGRIKETRFSCKLELCYNATIYRV